jgi:hypothetical protein
MANAAELAATFRGCVMREEVDGAFAAARGMGYVGLGDSLGLVRLLARKNDPRFDAAASRWISRWVIAKGASVGEISIATAAMATLGVDPDSERAISALRSVVRSD